MVIGKIDPVVTGKEGIERQNLTESRKI